MPGIVTKILLTFLILYPLSVFAEPNPVVCPDARQLSNGVFYGIDQDDAGYALVGYFDVNHDIYQRWGLAVRGVKSISFPQVLRDANEALLRQKVTNVSDKASCSGGNRGGICQCDYLIEIPYEDTPHFYTMVADTMY